MALLMLVSILEELQIELLGKLILILLKILIIKDLLQVFTIGGCVVSWKVTLQTIVTLFITEAKYIAIPEACKEVI